MFPQIRNIFQTQMARSSAYYWATAVLARFHTKLRNKLIGMSPVRATSTWLYRH